MFLAQFIPNCRVPEFAQLPPQLHQIEVGLFARDQIPVKQSLQHLRPKTRLYARRLRIANPIFPTTALRPPPSAVRRRRYICLSFGLNIPFQAKLPQCSPNLILLLSRNSTLRGN